jgi:hypothetical protein
VHGMDSAELARREHANMIAALVLAGSNADGALIRRSGGVALIATGLPTRIFNHVLIEHRYATTAAVTAAVESTRDRGDRFVVSLRRGMDDRFVELMGRLGLVPLSTDPWMPGMALYPLSGDQARAPTGFDVRRVTDGAGLEDLIRMTAAGFAMPASIARAIFGKTFVGRPGVFAYVGYVNDEPIATGIGVRTGRTIGVYSISTITSARRRGYGTTMTSRIAADAAAAGCDTATLQASQMGYPIYERLGYRTVVEYMGYVDPSSLAPVNVSAG